MRRRLAGQAPTVSAGAAELNVTPVLNMFTILIPFLVSMTAFSHLAVQAFQLPSDESPGHAQTVDSLPLTVALGVDAVTVAHGDRVLASVARTPGGTELEALGSILRESRTRMPALSRAVVAVEDQVTCADIVTCLDHCREAGFVEVGLAAGTNLGRSPAAASMTGPFVHDTKGLRDVNQR